MLLLPLMWGCDDYNYKPESANRLGGMDLTDLHFTSTGGTKHFTVEDGSGVITVESNEGWCEATASGNTVNVTADMNASQASRIATLTIIRGKLSTQVSVIQIGNIFQLEESSVAAVFTAATYSVGFITDFPATASTTASWIHNIEITDNSVVTFDVERNPYGQDVRTGIVTIESNDVLRTLRVVQDKGNLMYEDFVGTYTANYATSTGANDARTRSLTVTLTPNVEGRSYILRGIMSTADEALSDGIIVDYVSGVGLRIRGQRTLVRSNGYHLWFLTTGFQGTGLYIMNPNYAGTMHSAYMDSDNIDFNTQTGELSFEMVDTGSWNGYTMIGWRLRNYSFSGTNNATINNQGNANGKLSETGVTGDTSGFFRPIFTKQI